MRLLAYAAAATSLMIAGAAADPIEDRKANMKERGALMRVLAPIAQGQQPFDAATVLDALEQMNTVAQAATDIDALWPQGSDSGDTKAAEAIWTDRAGFEAANGKFATDVAAALEAAPQDLASFQAVFGPVAANCGSCHEVYRN